MNNCRCVACTPQIASALDLDPLDADCLRRAGIGDRPQRELAAAVYIVSGPALVLLAPDGRPLACAGLLPLPDEPAPLRQRFSPWRVRLRPPRPQSPWPERLWLPGPPERCGELWVWRGRGLAAGGPGVPRAARRMLRWLAAVAGAARVVSHVALGDATSARFNLWLGLRPEPGEVPFRGERFVRFGTRPGRIPFPESLRTKPFPENASVPDGANRTRSERRGGAISRTSGHAPRPKADFAVHRCIPAAPECRRLYA